MVFTPASPTVAQGSISGKGMQKALSRERCKVWKKRSSLISHDSIQYAAAPVGALRWQAPQTPATNRTVVLASEFGPYCPQSLPAVSDTTLILGDEDCLYLNVYASASLASGSTNSTGLPVLVSIHGGGYGEGSGQQDMSAFVNANDNDLIAVTIQYRVCHLCPLVRSCYISY